MSLSPLPVLRFPLHAASSLAGKVGGGSSDEGKPIGACVIFLFFIGPTCFPKPCVNIRAKNYMAYIKERREYDSSLVGMKPDIIPLSKTRIMWRVNFEVAT